MLNKFLLIFTLLFSASAAYAAPNPAFYKAYHQLQAETKDCTAKYKKSSDDEKFDCLAKVTKLLDAKTVILDTKINDLENATTGY